MKLIFGIVTILFSINIFANQINSDCQVVLYLPDGQVSTKDLVTHDGYSLQLQFNNYNYNIQASEQSIAYTITGLDDFEISGIAPPTTKESPFILKFKGSFKNELRCFSRES